MLDIDLPTLLLEIANFLALSAALYFFLFRRVVKAVEQRASEKAEIQRKIEEELDRAETLRNELEGRLAKISDEVDEILSKARATIEIERQRMVDEIQEMSEKRLAEVEHESLRLQKQELLEYNETLISAIEDVSGKLIGKVAPVEVHNALVNELNQKVIELGRVDMRQVNNLRRSLSERMPTAFVTSARELTADQQRQVVRTVSALADRSVNVELDVQPDLIAGMKVRIGDMLVENSISAQLTEYRGAILQDLSERLAYE
jgi:F0F1-type ATP synthase delta subunit